ncbi:MAG TPA: 7-cyano-7-deazaguanine synthase, partial [Pseudobdellovibrionaceae bacterium]|nr:7-cyano-7-deazaguanine synthase [Pseudobdellovibrionaceae bacterium]
DRALFYSTQNHVEIRCFTVDMNKEHIVKLGTKLQVPWRHLWPCYFGEEQWCGTCESCQRFFRALQLNGIYDIKN